MKSLKRHTQAIQVIRRLKWQNIYIARCFEGHWVKTKHQHPTGLLQPLPIPSWKWEIISIDFVTRLPKNQNLNDSIMVVVEKLSKASHFIPVKTTYKAANIADIFLKQIF